MMCLCVQWQRKSWQFAYWLPKSWTTEQTLADISITTRIGMCTEVKVKYWGPILLVPVWLEYQSYAQLSKFSCLHFSWNSFSFCSLNCKFMNVVLASYEIHRLNLDSSCMWRLGLGLLCHLHVPHVYRYMSFVFEKKSFLEGNDGT
jgi:hypothetical protein